MKRLPIFLTVVAVVVAVIASVTGSGEPARAAPGDVLRFQLTDVQGTIDPFTYTDGDGTFTISEMTLTENPSTRSTIVIDTSTGMVENRLVIDVTFNNGKPGALGADLSGTFTIEESGQLLPPAHPICQELSPVSTGCANLLITSGVLAGAGPFDGTTAEGENPTIFPEPDPPSPCPNPDPPPPTVPIVKWSFSPPDSPPKILVNLPSPPFINGQNIPIHGEIVACLIPFPVGGTAEVLVGDAVVSAKVLVSGSGSSVPYAAAAVGVVVVALAGAGLYVRWRLMR